YPVVVVKCTIRQVWKTMAFRKPLIVRLLMPNYFHGTTPFLPPAFTISSTKLHRFCHGPTLRCHGTTPVFLAATPQFHGPTLIGFSSRQPVPSETTQAFADVSC